MTAHNKAGHSI